MITAIAARKSVVFDMLRVAILVLAAVLSLRPENMQASAPRPVVSVPLRVADTPGASTRNYPFFSDAPWLAQRGYIENEVFLSGAAHPLSTPYAARTFEDGEVEGRQERYTTRMVVRRPADPSRPREACRSGPAP